MRSTATPVLELRTMPTVSELIPVIHYAGGFAVWAQPFWGLENPEGVLETIDRFRGSGIDGVECFYATDTREQAETLVHQAGAAAIATVRVNSARRS